MYRILTILWLLMLPGIISGQQAYDCLLKAKAYIKSGNPDLAINLITEILPGNQGDSRLYIGRAEAKLAKGDYTGAILDFNTANKYVPNAGEYGLARIYSLKGDAATAVYHLERNLSSDLRRSEKDIMLDPSFSIIENKPEWRQLWKKEWYPLLERSILEIEYNLSRGSIEEARATMVELKASYSGAEAISYIEALISYSAKNYGEAVKILSRLVTEDAVNENYLRLYARAQTGNGNFTGASELYSRLINMEVIDAGLLMSRAECYMKSGETEKARTDVERYLEINPADKNAISMAGRLEAVLGDNLKAMTYFSKNIELHPDDPVAYIDRANSYLRSKTWNWAINDYSMSLDLRPDNPEAWLSKGIALLNAGKPLDACHDFRRSLALGNKKAAEYINKNCIK